MTDSEAHLDVVDRALGEGHPEIRVCLDLDVSWRPLGRRPAVHIGTRRSPLHTPEQAADFAKAITRRAGFRLVGVMGYEGQIAGLGDAPPGHPVRAQLIRLIQGRSVPELRRRRTETIRLIQALTTLEFVNGGGTGSLESTARDARSRRRYAARPPGTCGPVTGSGCATPRVANSPSASGSTT
jgi:D-serine deaminase-like pyridoxal phosphate-dependent protein